MLADEGTSPNTGCMYSHSTSRKADSAPPPGPERPALKSRWLLDAVKERALPSLLAAYRRGLRLLDPALRRLARPRDMGGPDVEAFLTMLATQRQVSPPTHRQALSAILVPVPRGRWCRLAVDAVDRATTAAQAAARVLTVDEVPRLLAAIEGDADRLLARLLYGTGMRKLEALSLRLKEWTSSAA